MGDLDLTTAVLRDGFQRVREQVEHLCADLDEHTATFQVDPGANTPAWLLWHLTRVQDDHVAGLAGVPQAWDDWADRFDLPFDRADTGYGHSIEQVRAVRVVDDLLPAYHADVDALTRRYLDGLTPDQLERVVDDAWDPPVTAAVRLVSVLGDALAHLGQAAFVVGVAHRRD